MFFIAPALPLHWFQANRSSATTLMASEATIEAVLDNLQLSLNFPQAEASSYYIYSSQFLTLELNYNGRLQRTQFLPVIRLSLDSNPGPCENSDAHFLRMRLCNDAGCSKWSPKINVAQSTWLFFSPVTFIQRAERGKYWMKMYYRTIRRWQESADKCCRNTPRFCDSPLAKSDTQLPSALLRFESHQWNVRRDHLLP